MRSWGKAGNGAEGEGEQQLARRETEACGAGRAGWRGWQMIGDDDGGGDGGDGATRE